MKQPLGICRVRVDVTPVPYDCASIYFFFHTELFVTELTIIIALVAGNDLKAILHFEHERNSRRE